MAQKELEELFELRNDYEIFAKTAYDIRTIIEKNHIDRFQCVLKPLKEEEKKFKLKIEELEKYALCNHVKGEADYAGHDSHKDYYEVRCKKCKMIMEDYSI